jgi:hypothetical protein
MYKHKPGLEGMEPHDFRLLLVKKLFEKYPPSFEQSKTNINVVDDIERLKGRHLNFVKVNKRGRCQMCSKKDCDAFLCLECFQSWHTIA